MSEEPKTCSLPQPHDSGGLAAGLKRATSGKDAFTGLVISLLGVLASLNPGDLLVALPFLSAGLYVSIVALRMAPTGSAAKRVAIAGVASALLGLATTAILFFVFID